MFEILLLNQKNLRWNRYCNCNNLKKINNCNALWIIHYSSTTATFIQKNILKSFRSSQRHFSASALECSEWWNLTQKNHICLPLWEWNDGWVQTITLPERKAELGIWFNRWSLPPGLSSTQLSSTARRVCFPRAQSLADISVQALAN